MTERIRWLLFTIISCAIVTLATSLMGYFNLDDDQNLAVDITKNWQAKAILDLQVSLDECPSGYQNVTNSVWPGTTNGCWCGDISRSSRDYYEIAGDLLRDHCDSNQTKAGCTEILQTSAIPMNTWSTINGTKATLCAQRSNESWADVANYSGSACPPGFKKCGISAENAFCTVQNSKCPINDIQMIYLTLPRDSDFLSQCTDTRNCVVFAQDSNTAQIIKYQRGDTFDALPTSQFRLNEYGMCKDSAQDDVTPGRSVFALFGKAKVSCGNEGDAFWNKTIYQVSEQKLFDWNGVSSTIQYLSKFGYYDKGHTGNDYQYSLFSRSYIPWKRECRDQMNLLIQKNDAIASVKNSQLMLMLWSWVTCFILVGIVPIIICVSVCLENANREKFAMGKIMRNLARFVHYFIRIAMIQTQISSLRESHSVVGLYSTITQKGCTTPQVSDALKILQKSINIAHYGTIISIAYFVCITLLTIYFFILDRKKQLIIKDQLSESFADPQTSSYQPNQNLQSRDIEVPYSQYRDYEIQYLQNQQQPIVQHIQSIPPAAPPEDEMMYAKPLYSPFEKLHR